MKERAVAYSPEARRDLTELYDWIAINASPRTAVNYVGRVLVFCGRLSTGAERGHRRDDLRPGLRILGFERRLTIAFTVDADAVTVLRIFYRGRDWESDLG